MPHSLSQQVGAAFFGAFKDLRPVQRMAIPPIMDGSDVLIRSATSSGKTEAAIAPLVERYIADFSSHDAATIVIVSPTKALVNDLRDRLSVPLEKIAIRIGVKHGDISHLNGRAQVLITTPETFDSLIGRRDPVLSGVRAVVLDEVHLLFNAQRGLQAGLSIRRLEIWLNCRVQVVGLSATIGSPRQVWQFFRPDRVVVDVSVSDSRSLDYVICPDSGLDDVCRMLDRVAKKKALIFVDSRKSCEALVAAIKSHFKFSGRERLAELTFAHHSSLTKSDRNQVEERFKYAQTAICVATPTLEIGIDIGDIDIVFLYGIPNSWQALAQRIGRGGRRGRRTEAVLLAPRQKVAKTAIPSLLGFQALLAQWQANDVSQARIQRLYGAFAQQICSEIDARGDFVELKNLKAIGTPWPHLDANVTDQILESLVSAGILQKHPLRKRYGPDDGLHDLRRLRQVWSNFSDGGQSIDVRCGADIVGYVSYPSRRMMCLGSVFLLAGRAWRVRSIGPREILVEQTNLRPNMDLLHGGKHNRYSCSAADWMRRVICDGTYAERVPSRQSREAISRSFEPLRAILRSDAIPFVMKEGMYCYFTFAGVVINGILARHFGLSMPIDDILLTSDRILNFVGIPLAVSGLKHGLSLESGERSLFSNLLPEELRAREDFEVLTADGALEVILRRLQASQAVLLQECAFV